MATIVQGDTLRLSELGSATGQGTFSMGAAAGSTSTPISMSSFAIDSVGTIDGFTYLVENTTDSYDLTFSGAGSRFPRISSQPANFTWNVQFTGSNTTNYITLTGSPSSSANVTIGDMNPQDPSTQTELMTIKEHVISASFNDGFNDHATNYNTVISKTIYSVDTYDGNTALCLTSDSPVILSDGTEMEIGDLFEGDELRSFDIKTLGDEEKDYLNWSTDNLELTETTVIVKNVTYSFSEKIYNINNGEVKATYEHPMLVKDASDGLYRFKEVFKLNKGDKLIKGDSEIEITSIDFITDETVEIVTIDVEDEDVYLVNGYITHNKGGNVHTDNDSIDVTQPVLYLESANIDSDASVDGDPLLGSNIWPDSSGNGFDSFIGSGSFELQVGTTRQVRWAANSWLDIPDNPSLDFTPTVDEFTVIWRLGDTIGSQTSGYAVSKATAGTGDRMFGMYIGGSTTWTAIFVGGQSIAVSPATINPNELYIVTVEVGAVNVWKDGSLILSNWTTFGSASAAGVSWNIGGRTDGGYLINADSWSMDMVAIIPKSISTTERLNIQSELQINP